MHQPAFPTFAIEDSRVALAFAASNEPAFLTRVDRSEHAFCIWRSRKHHGHGYPILRAVPFGAKGGKPQECAPKSTKSIQTGLSLESSSCDLRRRSYLYKQPAFAAFAIEGNRVALTFAASNEPAFLTRVDRSEHAFCIWRVGSTTAMGTPFFAPWHSARRVGNHKSVHRRSITIQPAQFA
jgi:hypothetical protein